MSNFNADSFINKYILGKDEPNFSLIETRTDEEIKELCRNRKMSHLLTNVHYNETHLPFNSEFWDEYGDFNEVMDEFDDRISEIKLKFREEYQVTQKRFPNGDITARMFTNGDNEICLELAVVCDVSRDGVNKALWKDLMNHRGKVQKKNQNKNPKTMVIDGVEYVLTPKK